MEKIQQNAEEFARVFRQTVAFRQYRSMVKALEKDRTAKELLSTLIRYKQNPPNDIELLVDFERELERCEILQLFLAAEREMVEEYQRLSTMYLGAVSPSCGGSGGCGSQKGCCRCQGSCLSC